MLRRKRVSHEQPAWLQLDVPWKTDDRSKRRARFAPTFNAKEMTGCERHLDEDAKYYPDGYVEMLLDRYASSNEYISLSVWSVFPKVASVGMLVPVGLTIYLALRLAGIVPKYGTNESMDSFFIAGMALLMFAGWALHLLLGGWELQFYGQIAKAMKMAESSSGSSQYRMVRCVNIGGKAARYLFSELQGGRRTWASPPAVADGALSAAYPLINISLDVTGSRDAGRAVRVYANFVYYSAGLFAIERSDLIPLLRKYYEDHHSLPCRSDPDVESIPERDVLFLDPMRKHHRWMVAKEYLYPLAAWLSLAVSVGALVVSLSK